MIKNILDALDEHNINTTTGVPDGWIVPLIKGLDEDKRFDYIPAAREEECTCSNSINRPPPVPRSRMFSHVFGTNDKRTDSPKNCQTKAFFLAPTTFRTPTSFALFSLRAVLKFIKLIQAITKTIMAMMANKRILSISPPISTPFSNSE